MGAEKTVRVVARVPAELKKMLQRVLVEEDRTFTNWLAEQMRAYVREAACKRLAEMTPLNEAERKYRDMEVIKIETVRGSTKEPLTERKESKASTSTSGGDQEGQ
jgi:hypothetical protein